MYLRNSTDCCPESEFWGFAYDERLQGEHCNDGRLHGEHYNDEKLRGEHFNDGRLQG